MSNNTPPTPPIQPVSATPPTLRRPACSQQMTAKEVRFQSLI